METNTTDLPVDWLLVDALPFVDVKVDLPVQLTIQELLGLLGSLEQH